MVRVLLFPLGKTGLMPAKLVTVALLTLKTLLIILKILRAVTFVTLIVKLVTVLAVVLIKIAVKTCSANVMLMPV